MLAHPTLDQLHALGLHGMAKALLFAILFGFSLMALGEWGERMRGLVDDAAHAVFGVIRIIMKAAPIGAFGAMAYTIGEFGPPRSVNSSDCLRSST